MTAQDQSAIDERLLAFERAAAASSEVPDLDAFLPPDGDPERSEVVRELARIALELRWARGDRPDVDEYLTRYPELSDPEARAAVAYEDYRQRVLAGDRPSRDEYHSRYGIDVAGWPSREAPTSRRGPTSIDGMSTPEPVADSRDWPTVPLPGRAAAERPTGPEPGEMFLRFHLVRELGCGAFARVFLAEQADLAGRLVALKVSTVLAAEVRTLARLQHTNIVPVYSVHRSDHFQAVCMPFFGATTLGSVFADVGPGQAMSGQAVANAVRRRQLHRPTNDAAASLKFLETASSVDATLWVAERLADALAHAHERGVVHRDIKPANILIADDGQPMLLDFNLAQDENEASRARAGGTLPYMAPEQIDAFLGGPRVVDGRADLFSLGVLVFAMLSGRLPYPSRSGSNDQVLRQMRDDRAGRPLPLRQLNPAISPAVESIVYKCLAPDLAKRYQSAGDLRDDIARHRANLALRHAREPSLRERARKWARRNPRLVSPPAIFSYSAALALALSVVGVNASLNARARRQDAERQAAFEHYQEFMTLADRVRLAAGSPSDSAEVLQLGTTALDRYAATDPDWKNRAEVVRLPAAERDRLRSEIGELAFFSARAAAQTRRDADLAVRLNALADVTLGADAQSAVAAQRSELTGLAPAEIGAAVADSGRGGLLRAHDLAARGRFREALPLVSRFVAKNPDDFGGWFLKARCHDRLGHYDDARAAYSTCAALRPGSARPIAARGEMAFKHGKDLDQARADFERAIQLEPHLFEARLNRALLLRRVGRYDEALEELNVLVADPKSPTRVYFVRALVKEAAGDRAGADADRAEGMKRAPADPASFVTRGLAREPKDQEGALADFIAAERLDPFYDHAIANQAWILGEKMNRPADALVAVDRLLELYPDHHTGRGGRAVLLARLGRTEEAISAIRRYLVDVPFPSTYYQAGCVFAIVSKTDPKHRDEAVRLTAKALLRGFGHDFLLKDEDLDPIRDDEQFRKLVDGVKVMKDLGGKK